MSSILYLGDSRELIAKMDPCSIDAIVTDPPYEIGFMGRAWDSTGIAYDPAFWALCLRVLKPGGHLVSFGACRTYHRIAVAIEDAGFEVRDCLQWIFGSGFPKSLNVSLAIDKSLGGENRGRAIPTASRFQNASEILLSSNPVPEYDPATPEAQQWEGWGTALKPAYEPIILARRPMSGTVAASVLKYGTGGLNVDGCRVGDGTGEAAKPYAPNMKNGVYGDGMGGGAWDDSKGRWPPNILLSPEAAAKLGDKAAYFPVFDWNEQDHFYYAAKASREEREAGCDYLPAKTGAEAVEREDGSAGKDNPRAGAGRTAESVKNHHPTVKPVSLMRWLCRLITPPGGLVLDPFAGSGTTGIAAVSEGFNFIGIEMEPEHHAIAMARIEHAASVAPETNRETYTPPPKKQLGLFS